MNMTTIICSILSKTTQSYWDICDWKCFHFIHKIHSKYLFRTWCKCPAQEML